MRRFPEPVRTSHAGQNHSIKLRSGTIAMAALTAFLCCGATAPQGCQPQPEPSHTGAEAGAVAILAGAVIGTVVLVEVHHAHHTVKGCVLVGQSGLEVQTEPDRKSYALTGNMADVRIGDRVKFDGAKIKRAKDSVVEQTFEVKKLSKDYGPCKR